jgi:hypothetical protein
LDKRHNGASNKIPPDVLKRLGEKISSQALELRKRVEAVLPEGVTVESTLDRSALSITYAFTHDKMGQIGRIDVRFTGG